MAASYARTELEDMKAKQFISLIVGITSVVLSPIASAAGHSGGLAGGTGHFGGGGFRGGGGFSAAGHAAGGVLARGGGVGFGGVYRGGISAGPTYQSSGGENRSMKSYAGRNAILARQQNRPAASTNQNMRSSSPQSSATVRKAMANHRVFARHDGNWHHDWDRHRAHFDRGHMFVFVDGFWWGLYAWDYYPDYAYGYGSYPSDYYNSPYGSDDYPYDSSDAYSQNPYSYYNGYAPSVESGNAVVSSIQSQLAKLGYYRGAIDGVAGDETQAAIARYQQDNDLSVTGTVTAATLQSLGLAGR